MIGILAPDEIEAMLRRHRLGRIGCSTNDRPYVAPIAYAYDGEAVYSYSGMGRKIETMREQPLVCFELDEVDGPSSWRSVVAEGVYEELTDEPARRAAIRRVGSVDNDLVPVALRGDLGNVVFRLRLMEKSGRFERRDA